MLERYAAKLTVEGIIIALLMAALLVQTFRIEGFRIWPIHVHGLREKLADSEAGRATDRSRYEQAQRDAKTKNEEQVRQIEQRQEEVTHEVTRDLNSRLERLRGELRSQGSAAGRKPGGPATGADGKPRPGSDEAAGVCLAPEEQLRAAENEERHDQLITWVEKQLAVPR